MIQYEWIAIFSSTSVYEFVLKQEAPSSTFFVGLSEGIHFLHNMFSSYVHYCSRLISLAALSGFLLSLGYLKKIFTDSLTEFIQTY